MCSSTIEQCAQVIYEFPERAGSQWPAPVTVVQKYRHGDSNPGFRRERAAS
jgi:hypothetical protein